MIRHWYYFKRTFLQTTCSILISELSISGANSLVDRAPTYSTVVHPEYGSRLFPDPVPLSHNKGKNAKNHTKNLTVYWLTVLEEQKHA